MQKQIIFFYFMLAATAVSAQFFDFKPGTITATMLDDCTVQVSATPPTPQYLLECRYELVWKDSTGHHSIILAPYSCADTFSFEIPFADTFKLQRRVFWQPGYGTQWRLTNFILLPPCNFVADIQDEPEETVEAPPVTVPDIVDCASLEGFTLQLGCDYFGFLVITNAFGNVVTYQEITGTASINLNDLPPGFWFIHLIYITHGGYRDEVEKILKT